MKGVTTMHSLGKIRILVATSRIALTLANNIVVVSVEVRILLKLLGLSKTRLDSVIKNSYYLYSKPYLFEPVQFKQNRFKLTDFESIF